MNQFYGVVNSNTILKMVNRYSLGQAGRLPGAARENSGLIFSRRGKLHFVLKRSPLKRSTKPLKRTGKPKAKRSGPPRRGRMRDAKYLAYIRSLTCSVCLSIAREMQVVIPFSHRLLLRSEAAHVGERGLGQKCSDRETVPLCATHHRTGKDSHHVLGKKFWAHHGLNRDAIVKELNRLYDGSVTHEITHP